jgi:hypothetical protein
MKQIKRAPAEKPLSLGGGDARDAGRQDRRVLHAETLATVRRWVIRELDSSKIDPYLASPLERRLVQEIYDRNGWTRRGEFADFMNRRSEFVRSI